MVVCIGKQPSTSLIADSANLTNQPFYPASHSIRLGRHFRFPSDHSTAERVRKYVPQTRGASRRRVLAARGRLLQCRRLQR